MTVKFSASRRKAAPPLTHGARTPRQKSRSASVTEPAVCPLCGAVYWHRVWREHDLARSIPVSGAAQVICPACRLIMKGRGRGHVVVRGDLDAHREAELHHRVRNVAARARFTQPERRLVSVEKKGGELHIITTSQKLAHRIAREVEKAFRGRTTYAWSDRTGELEAMCDLS